MRSLGGVVLKLLGRHGANLSPGVRPGSDRQRGPLLSGELPVGVSEDKLDEQAAHGTSRGCARIECEDGDTSIDPVRQAEIRVAPALDNDSTLSDKQVYDIVNAGPRQRFVVLGTKGPFIVHNCVQAIARDILLDNAFAIKKRTGLYPVHTVHDELIYIVPEANAEQHLATVQEVMRTPPAWWPELVVWSEGDVADSYGAAK